MNNIGIYVPQSLGQIKLCLQYDTLLTKTTMKNGLRDYTEQYEEHFYQISCASTIYLPRR